MSTQLGIIRKAAHSLGYSSLKKEQEEAIAAFISGNDVFVSLPTGYGKSLCFALLPVVFDILRRVQKHECIVMVVSLLSTLMKDQVGAFTSVEMTAVFVNDESASREQKRKITHGECQLVFISPEALFKTVEWRGMLSNDVYRKNLVGFIVDEAHCVKKW